MVGPGPRPRALLRIVLPGLAATLLLLTAPPLPGEVLPAVRLSLFHHLYRGQGGQAEFLGTGQARLSLEARGKPAVRAGMAIEARVSEAPAGMAPSSGPPGSPGTPGMGSPAAAGSASFDLSRAWVRVRFPLGQAYSFRIMAGKSRLSWGQGAYFNAGDLLFGSAAPAADFTDTVLRDETRWLLSAYLPLGNFAFFEPLVLPPSFLDTMSPGGDSSGAPPGAGIKNTAAGGRIQAKVRNTLWEAGYLYRGTEEVHQPYLALQGHLLTHWYAAAAARVPAARPETENLRRSLEISLGLLHLASSPEKGHLALRLEALIRPDGPWTEAEASASAGAAPGTTSPAGSLRGLLLFPEIIWSPSRSLDWVLRGLVSPVDRSIFLSGGLSWKPYQGFSLLLFLSGMAGEEEDLFGWNRPGGLGLSTGMVYSY